MVCRNTNILYEIAKRTPVHAQYTPSEKYKMRNSEAKVQSVERRFYGLGMHVGATGGSIPQ